MYKVRCKKAVLDRPGFYNYCLYMYEYEFSDLEQANNFAITNDGILVA
ncbi:MAG: hypothetical protein LBU60_05160 [Clostridiales bacterium]|jgi:hypothetical protein|nr:hypothetical protein [Clostridiales bacterium]